MAFVFALSFTAVMGVESVRERDDQETLLAYLMDAGEINQEMVITLHHFTLYVTIFLVDNLLYNSVIVVDQLSFV